MSATISTIIVQVDDAAVRVKLEGGRTQETHFFETLGTRTAKAGCEGEDYTHNGVLYDNSVKMIEMKVSISRETGKYNPEDERLFQTRSF